jgi:hypothetical protein
MSIVEWLSEVVTKKNIEDRQVLHQTVELMDQYYQRCAPDKPVADLQLTGVTAFFVAAKNIMIEPFSLEEARTVLCYEKYTAEQFLAKERELRHLLVYQNEACSYADFFTLFLKATKSEFLADYTSDKKAQVGKAKRIIDSTRAFFDDWERLGDQLLRLALVDCFLKRYLRGYVAAAIFIMAFEHLLDDALSLGHRARSKYDLTHIVSVYASLNKVMAQYFGHHKYVFMQTFAKFVKRRFSILFLQYSGIVR